jgi:hypothetical protein
MKMLDDSMPAAAMTIGQLKAMMKEVFAQAQVEASRKVALGVERVSAGRAASIAKKRRGLVLEACESGALAARRDGNRWSIRLRPGRLVLGWIPGLL